MSRTRRIRIAVAAVLLSTGITTSGLVAITSANAASPKLMVAPSTRLTNHKVVYVSGTGFKARDTVYITECQRTAKGAGGCDIFTATPVKITSRGVLPKTKFKVVTGTIGNGKCGTTATNLRKCDVSAGNPSGGDSAVFNIVFAAPK